MLSLIINLADTVITLEKANANFNIKYVKMVTNVIFLKMKNVFSSITLRILIKNNQ